MVKDVDPEKETSSRSEVIQRLPVKKWYSGTVKDHVISLFDHTSNAESEASLAAANISALVKITYEETLDIVLQSVVCPLIQINVTEKYLSPVKDPKPKTSEHQRKDKLALNLLPHGDQPILKKEPDNNLTRLIAAVLFLKLKKKLLNEGTQREMEEYCTVNGKQLSKLLTSRCYLGGKDRKSKRDEEGDGTKAENIEEKKFEISNSVIDPGDGDDNDDDDDGHQKVKGQPQ